MKFVLRQNNDTMLQVTPKSTFQNPVLIPFGAQRQLSYNLGIPNLENLVKTRRRLAAGNEL